MQNNSDSKMFNKLYTSKSTIRCCRVICYLNYKMFLLRIDRINGLDSESMVTTQIAQELSLGVPVNLDSTNIFRPRTMLIYLLV